MWKWTKELLIIVGSALVLSLIIKTFFFQSFWIPSSSMENTFERGDRILVTKWRPDPLEMRRGDVVVFKDPGGWLAGVHTEDLTGARGVIDDVLTFIGLLPEDAGEHLVKRIIGMPGDEVVCESEDGPIAVNGVELNEEYLKEGVRPCGRVFSTTVPSGYIWMMGDNRDNSADSRAHQGRPGGGSVPIANVVGTAFVTVWPLENWSGLGNPWVNNPDAPQIPAPEQG